MMHGVAWLWPAGLRVWMGLGGQHRGGLALRLLAGRCHIGCTLLVLMLEVRGGAAIGLLV